MTSQAMKTEKDEAAGWFAALQGEIVAAFEALEQSHSRGPPSDHAPGRFEVTPTRRTGEDGEAAGGGRMCVMRGGRVFEKVGVNISTVHGTLGQAAQTSMAARGVPGIKDDPRFWASGISLVAHMQNPHAPAVHMNTRMFWTPGAWWFGGGADLNPCIEYPEDTAHFHDTLKAHLDPHGADLYPSLKAWADEYFYIPHRKRARRRWRLHGRPLHWQLARRFRTDPRHRPRLPAGLAAAGRSAVRHPVGRGRQGHAAASPRPLCRIQPRL